MAVWFVARTQSNRERWAAENIVRQGHEHYLPIVLETHYTEMSGRRTKVAKGRPLFPNYIFVKPEHEQWHFLLGTYGISSVIMQGGRPATLSESVVQGLKAREVDGVVHLPPRNTFTPEQRVRITSGAFKDHLGLVEGFPAAARVKVLLSFLGRKTSILVAEASLEAA